MKDYSNSSGRTSAQVYVDILSDPGFKAVFGQQRNSDVLIDLLNVFLPRHRRVKSVSYVTTEIPQFSPFNKSVRLDLRCKGTDGSLFIVEVQCYHQKNFFRRCVLYAAKSYDSLSDRGDENEYAIPPVYMLGLLSGEKQGFELEDSERFVSEYTFREKITHKVPDETINFIFLELNRFSKRLEECVNLTDKWCYALKHVGTLDRLPEKLRLEAFERLFKACEIAKFTPEVRLTYEKDMITKRDYYNIIDTAREDGYKAGIAEGEARGKAEGRNEMLRCVVGNMVKSGMSAEQILACTGLSPEQLKDLTAEV